MALGVLENSLSRWSRQGYDIAVGLMTIAKFSKFEDNDLETLRKIVGTDNVSTE